MSQRKQIRRGLWIGSAAMVLCGALPATVTAADAPPFADLLRQAQTTAPRLVEGAAAIEIAKGQAQQAAVRSNPVVGLDAENIGAKESAGVSQLEITLSVTQTLELGDKRAVRVGATNAAIGVAEARASQGRTEFAYDLGLAYANAEAAIRRVRLAQEAFAASTEEVRVAQALVDAGKEAELRAVQARAASAAAQADVRVAEAEAVDALGRLSSLVGAPEAYTGVSGSILERRFPLAQPPATSAPGVALAEAERRLAEGRLRVEETRARPDLGVRAGVRRLSAADDTGLIAGLSVPIPLFDKNRGAVAAAKGEVNAASARLNAARIDTETGSRSALAQLAASETRLAAASQSQVAAEEAYHLARLGYEGGKTPLSEVLNARRAVTQAQGQVLDAQVARARAQATLARLTGRTPFGD